MDETLPDAILAVRAEHLPGLVALVAAPLVAWLAVAVFRTLARHGFPMATHITDRLDQMPIAAKAAALASLLGAAVHAAMVTTHWADERATAELFALDAAGFVVALGWVLGGRRGWRALNVGMLGGTIAAYACYVVRRGERVDLVGLTMTTVELAALMTVLLAAGAPARNRDVQPWLAAACVPMAVLLVLGLSTVSGGAAQMTHQAAAAVDGRVHGVAREVPKGHGIGAMTTDSRRPLSLQTTSPAGPIRWPEPSAAMPGMVMPPTCTAAPTVAQQRAAVTLVNRTVATVARYRSLAVAKAAGYVPVTPTGRPVVHYINPALYLGSAALDPGAVPSLVYVNTPRGAVLSAAMYLMPLSGGSRAPRPGGCLTQWHVHRDLCFRDFAVVARMVNDACPAGSIRRVTPPMMHVWLVPVPGGPLATNAKDRAQLQAASLLPVLAAPNGAA